MVRSRGRYAEPVKIYTRDGDDGTTGLYFGGRVPKDSLPIAVNGAVDEAQAALGWARAQLAPNNRIHQLLIALERDLWVLMAEVATAAENRHKLKDGASRVTNEMIVTLENTIDELTAEVTMPTEFVVPGETVASAALDVARTVVRRAERTAVIEPVEGSLVVPYLNRLSDLVWTMARYCESSNYRTAKGS